MLNCFAKDATSAEAEAARGGVRAPARREDGARWEAGRVVGVAAGRAARAGLEKRGWVEGGGEREGSVSVIFFLCPPRVPPVLSRARRHPGWTVGSTRPCAQRGDGIPRQVRAAGACAGEATTHDDDAGHENVRGATLNPTSTRARLFYPSGGPGTHLRVTGTAPTRRDDRAACIFDAFVCLLLLLRIKERKCGARKTRARARSHTRVARLPFLFSRPMAAARTKPLHLALQVSGRGCGHPPPH